MNNFSIIGNLTRDPETKTVNGTDCTNFTVAVNRRVRDADVTDYVRVTTWGKLAQSCARYLHKGSKAYVSGAASVSAYISQHGEAMANIEIRSADMVEFLTPRSKDGFVEVDDYPEEFDQ